MNGLVFVALCAIFGGCFGYNVRREAPYNEGPNNYNLDYVNYNQQEPSQRLFWGSQGSNQVGGTGLWGTLTNKFPFLETMFGKIQLSPQYGAPNRYIAPALAAQYGGPNQYPTQQYIPPDRYQAQRYQDQQFNQQPVFRQGFGTSGREVALTDDAVIVTAPFVPAAGAVPAPRPPAPQPPQIPAPQPPQNQNTGYNYDKPVNRLELPYK